MERLSIDEIIEHCKRKTARYEQLNGIKTLESADISNNFIKEYWWHRQVKEYLEELKNFHELKEEGSILVPPCEIGQTVYVLAECENIPEQLDGTLWDSDGHHGTATGYYCPYENDCPFDDEDFESCAKYKKQTAVFEDTVKSITYDECGIWISTENCLICSEIGRYIFLNKEEAEKALEALKESE